MTERVWYWLRERGEQPQLKQATVVTGKTSDRYCAIMIDGENFTRNVATRHLFTVKPVLAQL